MVITIAFYALLVFGYFYAVGKIWRGESEFDGDDPPAFWPFSVELWRGAGRAMPVLGLGGLILIGAGIVSDLVGKDSPSYDLVMAIGTRRPAADDLRGLPDHVPQPPQAVRPADLARRPADLSSSSCSGFC